MVGSRGMAQVIHNDLRWAKDMVAAAIAALGNFKDDLIRLATIVPQRNRLMPVRIEGPPNVLDGFDAVALEQLAHLLQRHRHPLMQLRGGGGWLGSQGAFEIVENRQQVADEGFFLRGGLLLGIAPGALLEVVEVGSEAQVIVLLGGQLLLEDALVRRRSMRNDNGNIRRIGRRAGRFRIDGWRLVALGAHVSFLLRVHDAVTNGILLPYCSGWFNPHPLVELYLWKYSRTFAATWRSVNLSVVSIAMMWLPSLACSSRFLSSPLASPGPKIRMDSALRMAAITAS